MGVAFWGAALILWVMAIFLGQAHWIGETMGIGAVYAISFGLYTAALAIGPVGAVSPWANASTIMLWVLNPTGGLASVVGILLFTCGAWILVTTKISRSVIMMLFSDVFLVIARNLDASNIHYPIFAYAASLFTAISIWMSIPIIFYKQVKNVFLLAHERPIWTCTLLYRMHVHI